MDGNYDIRVTLIGTTGSGISATANRILNNSVFKVMKSGRSITLASQEREIFQNGKKIIVCDNPGFLCTELSGEEVLDEITKGVSSLRPGPNAILYVMRIGRLPSEEEISVRLFLDLFGEIVLPYVLLVCTHKENLEGNSLNQYISTMPKTLKGFAVQCGLGQIAINNREVLTDDTQQRIMQAIYSSISMKKNPYYSAGYLKSSFLQKLCRKLCKQKNGVMNTVQNILHRGQILRMLFCVGLFFLAFYGISGFFSKNET